MTINEAVKQICKVPFAKSNTRKVLKQFKEDLIEKYEHRTIDGWCCACESDQAFAECQPKDHEEIKKEAHLQGYIKAGDEVMTRIEDMIQAKLKRNDNPILKAGLTYALTVINGL